MESNKFCANVLVKITTERTKAMNKAISKKNLALKALGITTAALVACFSAISISKNKVHAVGAPDAVYQWDYTIENVLTDYQMFVQTNANVGNHVVGGVAVGGTFTLQSSMADGQTSPSYVGFLQTGLSNLNYGSYTNAEPAYADYDDNTFYYEDIAPGYPEWLSGKMTHHTGTTPYIDFNAAFAALKAESAAIPLKSDAYTVSAADMDGTVLKIDFSKSDNIVIPHNVLIALSPAQLEIVGVDDINDFDDVPRYISFTGYNDDYSGILDFSNITYKGQPFTNNNAFKGLDGAYHSGEICFTGMKLVWNYPDLTTTLTAINVSGHLVAPQADVTIAGGNFEGGVVAKILTNPTAEAHYYSFDDPQGPRTANASDPDDSVPDSTPDSTADPDDSTADPDDSTIDPDDSTADPDDSTIDPDDSTADPADPSKPAAVSPIKIVSQDPNGQVEGAEFGLYSDPDCKKLVGTATSVIDKDPSSPSFKKAVAVFESGKNGVPTLSRSTTYYIKQISAPKGHTPSTLIVDAIVDSQGGIKYKLHGSSKSAAATLISSDGTYLDSSANPVTSSGFPYIIGLTALGALFIVVRKPRLIKK